MSVIQVWLWLGYCLQLAVGVRFLFPNPLNVSYMVYCFSENVPKVVGTQVMVSSQLPPSDIIS